MGAAKRHYGNAKGAPETLRPGYSRPEGWRREHDGGPLIADPGELVRPSMAEGWVEIGGDRFARAVPAGTAEDRQGTLF